jgi:Leucine rich repeat
LAINDNLISGSIPRNIGKLTNLIALNLGQTSLGGNIPKEIGNIRKLQMLDLSESRMSGEIPSYLGNLTAMTKLYLQNNKLEGHIPPQLSNLQVLILLNLSNNKLKGEPKEIMNLPSLSIGLYLSNNYLSGALPPEIGKLKNVVEISLSNNKLSGEIPNTIDGCQLLQVLRLDGNLLHGPVPTSFSNIKGMQQLDLSNNLLSGKVPEFVALMKLQNLNISFNNFVGQLPLDGMFGNTSAIDVRGNPKLCGGVREIHLPQCSTCTTARRYLSRSFVVIIILVALSVLFLILAMWFLANLCSRIRPQNSPQHVMAMKFEYNSVSYNELLGATSAFSSENLIGKGSFGAVYRADMSFDNITTVAIKVLNLEQHGACRSFLSECYEDSKCML